LEGGKEKIMTVEELSEELNIDYERTWRMVQALDGMGFTEDQKLGIIRCIIAWAK